SWPRTSHDDRPVDGRAEGRVSRPRWSAPGYVLGRGNSSAIAAPCVLAVHSTIASGRRVVGVTIDWQTVADGVALGAIYALMAVGIGLVFGVLRLVNFAYGQLIMAGAFALALASQWNWPVWAGIVFCLAVVLVLTGLMDVLVFRPLRGQSPAT